MTDQRALETIEHICGDDFCEDMDMEIAFGHVGDNPKLVIAIEKLGLIYRIAHSLVLSKSCHHVHDDWRKLAEETAVGLLDSEVSPNQDPHLGSSGLIEAALHYMANVPAVESE